MTARDEAIDAMLTTPGPHVSTIGIGRYVQALEAIPNDVLVRYAIERGALEPITSSAATADGDLLFFSETEPLYRVVEP